jgi:hypothetical protein
MAPAAVLTGKWATAEDTARELGVSAKRLRELKELAAMAFAGGKRKPRSQKRDVQSVSGGTARTYSAGVANKRGTKSAPKVRKTVGAARRDKS